MLIDRIYKTVSEYKKVYKTDSMLFKLELNKEDIKTLNKQLKELDNRFYVELDDYNTLIVEYVENREE